MMVLFHPPLPWWQADDGCLTQCQREPGLLRVLSLMPNRGVLEFWAVTRGPLSMPPSYEQSDYLASRRMSP